MGLFDNIKQGVLGNLSEVSVDKLNSDYGPYLFDGEKIEMGYSLIRDSIIFTDIRIIFVDRQGATGKKTSFKSIYLSHIIDVEMETAGTGFDDSEITITYLTTVSRSPRHETFESRKFEFPKKTDILPLYRFFGSLVLKNRREINAI